MGYLSTAPPHVAYFPTSQQTVHNSSQHFYCDLKCILEMLKRRKLNIENPQKVETRRIKTLYVNEDNCPGENKAKNRLSMYSILVNEGIFDKIVFINFDVGMSTYFFHLYFSQT